MCTIAQWYNLCWTQQINPMDMVIKIYRPKHVDCHRLNNCGLERL